MDPGIGRPTGVLIGPFITFVPSTGFGESQC